MEKTDKLPETRKFFGKGSRVYSFGNTLLGRTALVGILGTSVYLGTVNEAKADDRTTITNTTSIYNRIRPGSILRTGCDIFEGVTADQKAENAKAEAAAKAEQEKAEAAAKAEQEKAEAQARLEAEQARIKETEEKIVNLDNLTDRERAAAIRRSAADARRADRDAARAQAKADRDAARAQAKADRDAARAQAKADRQAEQKERRAIRSTESTANQIFTLTNRLLIQNRRSK